MSLDMIPETWLRRRVRLDVTRTPLDAHYTITCPGCGHVARVVSSWRWAVETAEAHAIECRRLHDLTWQECPDCHGHGEEPGWYAVHYGERCRGCDGWGMVRVG